MITSSYVLSKLLGDDHSYIQERLEKVDICYIVTHWYIYTLKCLITNIDLFNNLHLNDPIYCSLRH